MERFNVLFMKSIFLLIMLIFIVSCSRKSGRRSTTTSYNQETTNTAQINRKSTRSFPRNTSKASSSSNELNTISPEDRRVLTPTELFSKYNTAVFMIYTSGSQGSGFFISEDGLAVSNYHVFEGSIKGYEVIKLTNSQQYKVKKVLDYNNDLDYILFLVDLGKQKVNYIPIAEKLPKIGEKAYAIGSPRGLENTFSSGEISQIRDNHLIQISVPIDHGSSGGALLNSYGEVIGITTAGLDGSGANLNFAMSINVVK